MNILIVANHYAVCSARYATDAFTRLGHSVKHVGQPMGRNIWGMQVPEQYVWTPDARFQELPDAIIVMDSDSAILDGVRNRQYGAYVPLLVYGVDNHVRDYRRPYFDHYFLAHKSVSVMEWEHEDYRADRVDNNWVDNIDMTWLPCAYDPVAFPPSPVPWAEREYDVCMIGVMYPQRWALVHTMRAAGLKVLAGTGLVYDAYRDAYHNSRVALVSSFNGDLPIRLFEGAGMGCAVMADVIGDLALLNPTRQVLPIHTYRGDDLDDAVEVVQNVLSTCDDRTARVAYEWAQRHTWDARAQVIVSWLEARS